MPGNKFMPAAINNEPLVSILMNCRNGREFLREAIDSIYNQTYKNWEIIFWDNASSDGSAEIAKSYDQRLHYFRGDLPSVLGKARNMAISHVNGQYLAFLDTDDKWLENKLSKQIDLLEKNTEADFVYSNYFRLNMAEEGKLVLGLRRKQPEGKVFGSFLYDYPANLQTVMVRMSAVRKIGVLFDDALELSEEFDFFMRLLLKSQALYIDEALAVYRIHKNMSSRILSHKHAFEAEYVLNKLLQTDQSIGSDYKSEVDFFKAKIAYWKAKSDIENNSRAKASSELRPYRFINFKFFLLWLLTFLPTQVWITLHRYKIRGILR